MHESKGKPNNNWLENVLFIKKEKSSYRAHAWVSYSQLSTNAQISIYVVLMVIIIGNNNNNIKQNFVW